jgi:hypothetical protein
MKSSHLILLPFYLEGYQELRQVRRAKNNYQRNLYVSDSKWLSRFEGNKSQI